MGNLVTREEVYQRDVGGQIAVMSAYLEGKRIQAAPRRQGAVWRPWHQAEPDFDAPKWDWASSIYRVSEEPIKPFTVDFTQLHDQIIYVTMDENGDVCGWRGKPHRPDGHQPMWFPQIPVEQFEAPLRVHAYVELSEHGFTGYDRGEVDWSECIAVRPGHEEKEENNG